MINLIFIISCVALLLGSLFLTPAVKQLCFMLFTPILSLQNPVHADQTETALAKSAPGIRPFLTCFDTITEKGRLKNGLCPAVTAFQ